MKKGERGNRLAVAGHSSRTQIALCLPVVDLGLFVSGRGVRVVPVRHSAGGHGPAQCLTVAQHSVVVSQDPAALSSCR
jgi:hypothetical protein